MSLQSEKARYEILKQTFVDGNKYDPHFYFNIGDKLLFTNMDNM